MKILAHKLSESVVCTMPDGRQIEVTMLSAEGEDVGAEPDVNKAVEIIMQLYGSATA